MIMFFYMQYSQSKREGSVTYRLIFITRNVIVTFGGGGEGFGVVTFLNANTDN